MTKNRVIIFFKIKGDWPKIKHVDANLNALISRDELLQGKDSINVCREALRDGLASTMAKVRAVKYKNRGSIPRKGKEFSLAETSITSLVFTQSL